MTEISAVINKEVLKKRQPHKTQAWEKAYKAQQIVTSLNCIRKKLQSKSIMKYISNKNRSEGLKFRCVTQYRKEVMKPHSFLPVAYLVKLITFHIVGRSGPRQRQRRKASAYEEVPSQNALPCWAAIIRTVSEFTSGLNKQGIQSYGF